MSVWKTYFLKHKERFLKVVFRFTKAKFTSCVSAVDCGLPIVAKEMEIEAMAKTFQMKAVVLDWPKKALDDTQWDELREMYLRLRRHQMLVLNPINYDRNRYQLSENVREGLRRLKVNGVDHKPFTVRLCKNGRVMIAHSRRERAKLAVP